MKNTDIDNLWKSMNSNIDKEWSLDNKSLKTNKLRSIRKRLILSMAYELALLVFYGAVFIILIAYIRYHFENRTILIAGSIITTWLFTLIQLSIVKIYKIARLNYAKKTNELLLDLKNILKLSVKIFRITVGIAPFYMSFIVLFCDIIWGTDIIGLASKTWINTNIVVSIGIVLPLTIWALYKLRFKNIDEPWLKKLLRENNHQVVESIKIIEAEDLN